MREIKFRSWDESIGLFVYFDLMSANVKGIYPPMEWIKLPKEQFTGFQDKSGKDIYEGHIIKWKGHEVEAGKQIRPERIFEIEQTIESWYKLSCLLSNGDYLEIEIIGNIHESPELLKKENTNV